MRLIIKNFLCWIGLGSWLIEYCGICGRRQPLVWWAETPHLYSTVDPFNRTPCPECFDKLARDIGIFLRWYPKDESKRANGISL